MENGQHTWITNFIWGIADDVLRDLNVRGKYRDVILPMTVIRRLDAVLDMKASLDNAGITNQDAALRQAAGQAFYNTSKFTLLDLKARSSRQQLEADFRAYLDGFSPNVQEIIDNFEFRNQIPRLAKADALLRRQPRDGRFFRQRSWHGGRGDREEVDQVSAARTIPKPASEIVTHRHL